MNIFQEFLEAFIVKVNYQGDKKRRLKCPPGYTLNSDGTACVPMTAGQKQNLKIGARHATITKKGEGDALKKRQNRRTKRAMKFRAMFTGKSQ